MVTVSVTTVFSVKMVDVTVFFYYVKLHATVAKKVTFKIIGIFRK